MVIRTNDFLKSLTNIQFNHESDKYVSLFFFMLISF